VSLHNDMRLPSEAAVETMEVESRHSELTARVGLTARVKSCEDFKVMEFDTLKEKYISLVYNMHSGKIKTELSK
jgi:hypothetical protein